MSQWCPRNVERSVLKGTGQPHLSVSVSMASTYGNEDLSLNVGNLECPTTESISSCAFRRTEGCLIIARMKFSSAAMDLKNGVNCWILVDEVSTYSVDAAEVQGV